MDIKILKMLSGEMVIATLVHEDEDEDILRNPVRIAVVPNRVVPEQPQVGFAPWVEFTSDKEFIVQKFHVILCVNPVEEFIKQYNSMFSGIIAPRQANKIIMPGS